MSPSDATSNTPAAAAPLIDATALRALLASAGPQPVLLDCSFDLANPAAGEAQWQEAALPGARYASLDRVWSGPLPEGVARTDPAFPGRHPLPDAATLRAQLSEWGVGPYTPLVVYDRQDHAFAARAWWLLRALGHTQVRVLDGGLAAWRAAGGATPPGQATAAAARSSASVTPAQPPWPQAPSAGWQVPTVDTAALEASLVDRIVLDARAAERFRGEVEPLDPVAGHIPGARNLPYKANLAEDGRFQSPAALRTRFADATGLGPDAAPEALARIVQQCGSGVTACHNLLAMAVAGYPMTALYPGSWSAWCADARRPVARG